MVQQDVIQTEDAAAFVRALDCIDDGQRVIGSDDIDITADQILDVVFIVDGSGKHLDPVVMQGLNKRWSNCAVGE